MASPKNTPPRTAAPTAGAGQDLDTQTASGIFVNLGKALEASKGNQQEQDKAYRDAKLAMQRLATMDKRYEAIVKLFDARPELITAGAKAMLDLSNRAAQGSVDSDNKLYERLQEYANLVSTTNFKNDARIEDAKGGFYETVAVIGEFCHIIGFEQGAQYCKRFVNDWKASNTVSGKPEELTAMKGTMMADTTAPLKAIEKATGVSIAYIDGQTPTVQAGADKVGTDLSSGKDQGVITGQPVSGGAEGQSAAERAKRAIEKAAADSKFSLDKVNSLVGAYNHFAGTDGVMQPDEMAKFQSSKPFKSLTAPQQAEVKKDLGPLLHPAPEGTQAN